MKKSVLILAIILSLTVILASCGGASQPAQLQGGDTAQPTQPQGGEDNEQLQDSSDGSEAAATEQQQGSADVKDATDYTAKANQAWYDVLDFEDESEKENALKGLIEAPESLVIRDDEGNVVWNVDDYQFINEMETIPDTINPSLYRNTLYNSYAGLFEVCDGIYQVRGYDMANATFIRTDNGWIVFDVLMCKEDMEAAKALMEKHFGKLDIKAVLYSHSHIDHYGGVLGLLSQEDVADANLPLQDQLASGKVVVIGPEGFLEHAVSENVYAGVAMGRRAQYQYGVLINPSETGKLAMGIGLGQSVGHTALIAPTYDVTTNETITIDGLEIQFQLTPGTEAPAEMNAYFPKYRGLWVAENCTGTMHNLYTLRGAEIRNANDWAKYILQAEELFGDQTDFTFQSHNWPHWGTENVKEYMENTAAVYKFINDQTLHYINLGYTSAEISRMLELPDELKKVWYCRQYYGTLSHNVKAVYQRYMGWYDENPVDLNPLTPEDTAKKWVEYLGDTDAVLKKAKEDFDKGEYQWVAQVTRELVFADPSNQEARNLCADALEQLGYQAESGTWRNSYLTGAKELREGNLAEQAKTATGGIDARIGMTVDMIVDYIDINTDALKAQEDDLSFRLTISDLNEEYYLKRENGVLMLYKQNIPEEADAEVSCTKMQFLRMAMGDTDAIKEMTISGDETVMDRLVAYTTSFTQDFNIIEP